MTKVGRIIASAFALACGLSSRSAQSQQSSARVVGSDSVVVKPGAVFAAGKSKRLLLGSNYRDLWTTPIKVPVLDLRGFAGGIHPTKEGGGKQGRSLRFVAPDSSEFVFRPILKSGLILSDQFKHTVIWSVFYDEGSAAHPTSSIAAAPMLTAAQVLHATPTIVVMPDDTILGQFRKDFAGELGELEEYPAAPKEGVAFANAVEIVDSDELLERMNKNSDTQPDAREFLTAVLMDMLFGDNDRHPGQWKWARLADAPTSEWEPIPRDRDKVFVSFEGSVMGIARKVAPSLIKFRSVYPSPVALFRNALEYDRRLLMGLDKTVWDSTANSVKQRITNQVIDSALLQMPREYAASSRRIAEILRVRRDHLPEIADQYYRILSSVADVHGTDVSEMATVVRSSDSTVDVRMQFRDKTPWFTRSFNTRETSEIRIYLHGGNDTAMVTGNVRRSIPITIVGGNGRNAFADQSAVGGHRNPTRFYDDGRVEGVNYGRDTLAEKKDEDLAKNMYFDRRPWLHAYGTVIPPVRDRGTSMTPIVGIKSRHRMGIAPRIGVARYVYGFRSVPYSSMMKADVAYATTNRFELNLAGDKRFEESDVHVPVTASVSQFQMVEFRGFGNDVPDTDSRFFEVRQTQWQLRPAIGFALNPVSDVSIGPVVRSTVTDSTSNRFISMNQPYGFSHFAEAGLQLALHYESRYLPDTLKPRATVDVSASGYPGMWDAKTAYESIAGVAKAFFTLPVATRPVIALRGGGKKLFGDFPYFDAAFLGGSSSLRTEHQQRFAGDAAVYGSAELRVPVAQFPLVVPLDAGLIGFTDAGRVYVDGDSPGGWHTASGGGFWIGVIHPGSGITVLFTNKRDRRTVVSLGFAL
ncbi:MAG TPA: hypothetical protein VIF83_11170 [Gemmatimonadaceae bacterium]